MLLAGLHYSACASDWAQMFDGCKASLDVWLADPTPAIRSTRRAAACLVLTGADSARAPLPTLVHRPCAVSSYGATRALAFAITCRTCALAHTSPPHAACRQSACLPGYWWPRRRSRPPRPPASSPGGTITAGGGHRGRGRWRRSRRRRGVARSAASAAGSAGGAMTAAMAARPAATVRRVPRAAPARASVQRR